MELNEAYMIAGMVGIINAVVVSPLVAFALRQKSKLEKLEVLRENDRKDYDEHVKHSDLQAELLNKISETVSVFKYMLERIEKDISEIKNDKFRISKNGDNNSKSAV